MLLKDYFKIQKKQGLSTADKFFLYEKISLGQKNSQHGISRTKSLKRTFLKFGVFSFIFGLMGIGIFNSLSNNYKENRGLISFRKGVNDYKMFSHASAIGQIIKAQGHFTVTKNGQLVISDEFSDGDIISLDKLSNISFDINNSIKAQVVGPAKFTVHKTSNNSYRIHMLEGAFISVKSKDNLDSSQFVEVTTPDGVIIQETKKDKGEKIDFSIIKKEKKSLVLNKSTNKIKVSKVNLQKKSLPQTDLTPARKTTDSKQNNSGDTETNNIEVISGNNVLESGYMNISVKTGNNESFSGDFISVIEQKEVDETNQKIENIEQITYKSFIQSNIENVLLYYLVGEKNSFDISVLNLSNRLKELYKVMGEEKSFKECTTISDLQKSTEKLLQISKEQNLSMGNIIILKNRFFVILSNDYKFGQYKDIGNELKKSEGLNFSNFIKKINFKIESYLNFK